MNRLNKKNTEWSRYTKQPIVTRGWVLSIMKRAKRQPTNYPMQLSVRKYGIVLSLRYRGKRGLRGRDWGKIGLRHLQVSIRAISKMVPLSINLNC